MKLSGKVGRFARQIRAALEQRAVVTEAELDQLLRTNSVIIDPDWNLDVQTALNELAKQQLVFRLGQIIVRLPEPTGTQDGEPVVPFRNMLEIVRAVLHHQQREAAQAAQCMYDQIPVTRQT
ncbi:MAG: hypothetical protein U0744_01215 [Gemmataceae bacterium]